MMHLLDCAWFILIHYLDCHFNNKRIDQIFFFLFILGLSLFDLFNTYTSASFKYYYTPCVDLIYPLINDAYGDTL